jgi:hypothetical protein
MWLRCYCLLVEMYGAIRDAFSCMEVLGMLHAAAAAVV